MSKLEIWDNFSGWLDCSQLTEKEVKAEAEKCEVMYKVDGNLKSWKDTTQSQSTKQESSK